MPAQIACSLLCALHELGATKLSILGGEPTIYGRGNASNSLYDVIAYARQVGFKYIRLVTNGLFESDFDLLTYGKSLDEVTFSFDGTTPQTHDELRGHGTFFRALGNLEKAVSLGIRVNITFTVNSSNMLECHTPVDSVDHAIRWAAGRGASRVNFHPILKMGVDRDSWVGETYIEQSVWQAIYDTISSRMDTKCYPIPVRLPQRFVDASRFGEAAGYYGYCPVKMGERVEVHPNGQIQICALLKGTSMCIARFAVVGDVIKIIWEEGSSNEISAHSFDRSRSHPCAIISKCNKPFVPLCISFKPNQDEFIWRALGLDSVIGTQS